MRWNQVANLVPGRLLRSPAHRVLSGKYVLVSFTGRRSGRRYSTPVAYAQEGDTVWVSTDSRWWRNLVGDAPVQLRLRGHAVDGVATVITDETEAVACCADSSEAIPSYSKPAGSRSRPRRRRTQTSLADGRASPARSDRSCRVSRGMAPGGVRPGDDIGAQPQPGLALGALHDGTGHVRVSPQVGRDTVSLSEPEQTRDLSCVN